MPDVGGKKFSYTPEGRKAAKAYSKRTGKAIRTNYRGGKTVAKKRHQRGRSVETMASGRPIQWQSGPVGQRRKADYMSYVAPKAARKQLKKQAAAGGPGRRATRGAGGAKAGGAVKRLQGGGVTSVRGRGGPNVRPKVNVLGVGAAQAHQAAQRGGLAGQQATRAAATIPGAPPQMPGRPAPRLRPGYSKGGTVSYNDLIRSKGW